MYKSLRVLNSARQLALATPFTRVAQFQNININHHVVSKTSYLQPFRMFQSSNMLLMQKSNESPKKEAEKEEEDAAEEEEEEEEEEVEGM